MNTEPIAIVGAACRLSGGVVDLRGLWEVVSGRVDTGTEAPPERWPAAGGAGGGVGRGHFLPEVAGFDAAFFGIGPAEADAMDPAQRLLLEVAWEALEDAGVDPTALAGSRGGVYLGLAASDYGRRHLLGVDLDAVSPWSGTGSLLSVAAGRIAYSLGLRGPAMVVDTACSSSLVAVHLACQGLRQGECSLALAGGANLLLAPHLSVYLDRVGALSPSGRCRPFDADADGYVRGEGVGLVVLETLAAAEARGDRVLAVIRGSAINHDGRTNGLTAPSGRAQEEVIREALARSGVGPESVTLVETHGTGTPLGDAVEIGALRAAYGEAGPPCTLTSSKGTFGHTEAAAGITGLLAAVQALRRARVPPIANLSAPNPRLDLGARLRLAVHAAPWPSEGPRRAAVSAFGLAGTNAHLVLEEAPPTRPSPAAAPGPQVVVLSARSPRALAALAGRLAGIDAPLGDLAWSTRHLRGALTTRAAVVTDDPSVARAALLALSRGEPHPAAIGPRRAAPRAAAALRFVALSARAPAALPPRPFDSDDGYNEALAELSRAAEEMATREELLERANDRAQQDVATLVGYVARGRQVTVVLK